MDQAGSCKGAKIIKNTKFSFTIPYLLSTLLFKATEHFFFPPLAVPFQLIKGKKIKNEESFIYKLFFNRDKYL